MQHYLLVVFLVLSSWTTITRGQQEPVRNFAISLPSSYTGQGDDNDVSACTDNTLGLLSCVNEVIVDGMTELGETTNLSSTGYLQQFLKWNYTASGGGLNPNPHISFSFTLFTLNRIDLFFLNYPAENIGLPNIDLFVGGRLSLGTGGTPLGYTISNNDVLSSDDSTTREIQLQILPEGYSNSEDIRLEMSFSGLYNVDWFFLSEVRFQGGPSPPTAPPLPEIVFEYPQSDNQAVQLPTGDTLQLMCTVSTAGLFDWQWRHDGQILTENKTALATRTSVLIVKDDFNDSDAYTCEVKHQREAAFTASRTLRLSSMEVGGPTPTAAPSATTTKDPSAATTTTTPPETMPTTTIANTPDETRTPDGSLMPESSDGSGGSDILVIVGGVIVAIVFFLVLLVTIIVLTILFLKWRKTTSKIDLREENGETHRRSRKLTADDIQWQLQIYSTVNKETPPPIPPQNFGAEEITNKSYEHHSVQHEQPQSRQLTASYSQSPPRLVKLTSLSVENLCTNPIYTPSNGIDHSDFGETTFNELHIYAEAFDRSDCATSPSSSEPIYSEAIDPDMFSQNPPPSEDDLHPYGPIYADPKPLLKSEAPLEVTSDHIHVLKQLGIGQFGEVILAQTVGVSLKDLKLSRSDNDRSVNIQVAVKKLKPQAQSPILEAFEREIKFMSRLKDDNIVRLLAICTTDTPFIVMEYMENGDLNQYLQKHKLAQSDSNILRNELPLSILVYMAVQIASGMRYLASLKYVHRDMATRNCLIGKNFTVKISDFGMSRSLYESAYYRVRGRAMLPIRWMATESFYGRFSESTDVWAFGVTMWEIFTLAKQQPYEELDDQEVIQDAIRGASRRLLDKPEGCPQDVYEVMLRCWEYETDERAEFEEIFSSLADIHRQM